MKKTKYLLILSFIFSFLFFSIGFLTLKDYNVNWDEPRHFTRGQAILRFFLTGQKDYRAINSLSDQRISIYQHDTISGSTYSFFLNQFDHPPLNGILASFSNYIFYQKLGFLGDIESYHLFIIFTTSVLAFLIFFFTTKEYGSFAGFIAYLSLVLYPLFLGESHYNIKDPVEASFYALSIYWFYKGITKNNSWLVLVASLFVGFALATKFNIFFAFIPMTAWVIFYKWEKIKNFKWPFSRSITITFGVSLFIPWLILILSWPALWSNTFHNLVEVFNYYKDIGGTVYQPDRYLTFFGFNTYPIEWIIYATPLPILFFSLIGMIYALKNGLKENKKTSLLILMWFLIPILRVSVPHAGIYGGVRQIMEYVPAMAILSGIGANGITKLLNGYIVRYFKQFNNLTIKPLTIIQLCIILVFIPTAIKLISIHPNETVYFNELAGGLKGAYEKEIPSAGGDLGNVYRQGVNWLNVHAEKNARLSLVVNGTPAIPSIFLRKDISFSNDFWSGEKQEGEYIMNTTEIGWDSVFSEKSEYLENSLVPVYEIRVDGAPILKIWKNSPEYSKNNTTD